MKMHGMAKKQGKFLFLSFFLQSLSVAVMVIFYLLINVMFPWAGLVTGQPRSSKVSRAPPCNEALTLALSLSTSRLCQGRKMVQVTEQGWGSSWQRTDLREVEKQEKSRWHWIKALSHQCMLLLFHQILLTDHKFKGRVMKNFKIVTTQH